MIASTDVYEDLPEFRQEELSSCCRLCSDDDVTKSREHLLSDCPATAHLVSPLSEKIKSISPAKYQDLLTLPSYRRWLWILGGGLQNKTHALPHATY